MKSSPTNINSTAVRRKQSGSVALVMLVVVMVIMGMFFLFVLMIVKDQPSIPIEYSHRMSIEDFNESLGPLELYGMRHEPNTSHYSGSTFPAEITDFGIYRKTSGKFIFVERTTNIPLKIGTTFGYRYIVTGLEEEGYEIWGKKRKISVVEKYEHPTIKMPDGRSTIGSYYPWPAYSEDGKYKGSCFYTFDASYELVPGKWIFTVFYSGEELVSKTFQIGAEKESVPVDATIPNK